MDLLNSISNELQTDYMQFISVAFGVAFLTSPLLTNVTLNIPFLSSIDLTYQSALLAGLYAVIGNWLSRTYSKS